MSLNISDALNATSQQAVARTPVNSAHVVKRATGDPQGDSDWIPKPKSLPQEPLNPVIRAHAAVPTEESLMRLPDSVEPGKFKQRVRKSSDNESDSREETGAASAQRARCPYDPAPARQQDLDLLA